MEANINHIAKHTIQQPKAQNTEAIQQDTNGTFRPARKGTRQAQLVALLQRKSGATIEQIGQRLGWQAHTARAALTGVRKRGYTVERITKDGKASCYLIRAMADA